MKKFIEHMRKQPAHHQNRVIWIIAGIVAGILLILWLLIGNTKREDSGNVLNEVNSQFNQNKNMFPDLFNRN